MQAGRTHSHHAHGGSIRWVGRMLALAMLCLGLAVEATAAERDRTLVIGKVSDNPRKHYRRLKPMVDYVVQRLPEIDQGRVLMARDNAQMIAFLRAERVDWVTETVFSAVQFADRAGAEIALLKRKKGVREYATVFITRADSDITRLEDLGGRTLAVEDPGSTTAFFLPRVLLRRAGLEPKQLAGQDTSVGDQEVGLSFAQGEINIALWVHEGLTDAGAYSDLDWQTPDHTPPAVRDNLRIFHTSQPMPRAVELFRAGLPEALKQRVTELLLEAPDNAEGRRVLYAYQRTERFDTLDEETRDAIEQVREMLGNLEPADR